MPCPPPRGAGEASLPGAMRHRPGNAGGPALPPGPSPGGKDTRTLDIYADDQLDEAQFAAWVKQASLLPGERM